MSHTYLLDLYDLIEQRLGEVSVEPESEHSEGDRTQSQQGRYDVLTEFKQFLAERYNNKLPRRIRNKYSG